MTQLRVNVLGRPTVELGGVPLALSAKGTALLCYLAVTGRGHSRAELAGLLWSDVAAGRARANLRTTLAELRGAVGDALAITAEEVAPGSDWRCDLDETDSPGALGPGLRVPARELLAEVSLPGAAGFDSWLRDERARVARMLAMRLGQEARELAGSDPAAALQYAYDWVDLDPLDESAHRLVMELLEASGRRGRALAQFEALRRTLAAELGIDPSPETVALRDRLLRAEDSGPRRVGEAGAGPAAAASPQSAAAATDPLVGRDPELRRLRTLLVDDGCRLVTVVGPGGAGKTRLARAAAEALADRFDHGCAFVPLADVGPEAPVESTVVAIARSLGLAPGTEPPMRAVVRALRGREMLLVLDNVEQLRIAELVSGLLDEAPGLSLLATSRRRLGLGTEWLVPISGLEWSVPDGEPTDAPPAVELLMRRARRVRPSGAPDDDPDAIRRLCELVEGLPLALELAADALRSQSAGDLCDALAVDLDALTAQDAVVEERQRSMTSVLEASWGLLDPHHARVLARLSVLRAGFDARAAAAVAGANGRDLAALVDRSVVERHGASRFSLHPLLHRFAAERLDVDPGERDAALARHAAEFADRARRVLDGTITRDDSDPDHADLQSATAWLIDRRDAEDELADCVEVLWLQARTEGRFAEVLLTLEAALRRPELTPTLAARWHTYAATAAYHLGRLSYAMRALEHGMAEAGRPLPRRSPALALAVARAAGRQVAHRAGMPAKRDTAIDVDTLAVCSDLAYFLQRPGHMMLAALWSANAADSGDDPAELGFAAAQLGNGLELLGAGRLGRAYGRRADAQLARADDDELALLGAEARLLSHLGLADWDAAFATITRVLASRRTGEAVHLRSRWHLLHGITSLYRGDLADALDAFERTLADVGGEEDTMFAWCANGIASAHLERGEAPEPLLQRQARAVHASRDVPAPERFNTLATHAALCSARGDLFDASAAADAADAARRDMRFTPVWCFDGFSHLAAVRLAARRAGGRDDRRRRSDSDAACERLAAFARVYPLARARALWARGWNLSLDGREARAESAWRRAVTLAHGSGLPLEVARAEAALAGAATGRP